MSELFDESPAGPAAARRRGRQYLAATALSLALLGAAGCTASSTTGSTTDPASPAATGSATTASTPKPGQYVAGAWLSESQLPYAGVITWQVNTQALGTTLHGAVQLALPGSSFFDSSVQDIGTYCSIPALTGEAVADQQESFFGPITGSSLPSTPGIPATVSQNTIFYQDQSGATAAWGAIASGFAACAKFETGSVSADSSTNPSVGTSSRISDEPDVQCWTNLAAVSNLGPKVTDLLEDVCFVRHGTVITSVDLGFEGPAALSGVDFGPVDATAVSNLQRAVNAYGSS